MVDQPKFIKIISGEMALETPEEASGNLTAVLSEWGAIIPISLWQTKKYGSPKWYAFMQQMPLRGQTLCWPWEHKTSSYLPEAYRRAAEKTGKTAKKYDFKL